MALTGCGKGDIGSQRSSRNAQSWPPASAQSPPRVSHTTCRMGTAGNPLAVPNTWARPSRSRISPALRVAIQTAPSASCARCRKPSCGVPAPRFTAAKPVPSRRTSVPAKVLTQQDTAAVHEQARNVRISQQGRVDAVEDREASTVKPGQSIQRGDPQVAVPSSGHSAYPAARQPLGPVPIPHQKPLVRNWFHRPTFPDRCRPCPDHITGASGAWKDVLQMLDGFPEFKSAAGPSDLKQRVEACHKALEAIQMAAIQSAAKIADEQRAQLDCRLVQLKAAPQTVEKRIRAQLDQMAWNMERMKDGGFWDRRRAACLNRILSEDEIRLCKTLHDIKDEARAEEQAIQEFLNPATMAERIKSQISADLQALQQIITSNPFAGAVAEAAVVDELSRLPGTCRIFQAIRN